MAVIEISFKPVHINAPCPRCHQTNVFLEKDRREYVLKCLSCAYERELKKGNKS